MTGMSTLSRMSRAASIPFISPRRRMSIRIRSGRAASAVSTAAAPLETTPTTTYPSCFRLSARSMATMLSSSTTSRRASSGMAATLHRERDLVFGSGGGHDDDRAADLIDQTAHQPQAEGGSAVHVERFRQAHAVVRDDQAAA